MIKEPTTLSSSPYIKKFAIENLGCSKNQVDAEIMAAVLIRKGWTFCQENPEEAEVIIVNTCGFIESAKKEAVDTLLSISSQYPDKKVIAAGCMAQRYPEELKKSMPELAAIFGNSAPELIADLLGNPLSGQVYIPDSPSQYPMRERLLSFKGSAYVKIAEGCNNNCRYCAIPLIRGAVKSRPKNDIIKEIKMLLRQDVFEFNLVAQDLSHYGVDLDQGDLVELLKSISAIEGDFWVRLLYIHPDHFPLEILELMKKDSRILPYFDIPFQHADSRVLKGMGRKGDRQTYLELLKKIRNEIPNAVFRSTFLAGFSGENKKTAGELLRFQEEARFDWLGVFTYSPEEGTLAFRESRRIRSFFERRQGQRIKKQVENRQIEIMTENLNRFLNQELLFLIEEEIPDEDLFLARGYMQAPEVDGLTVIHGENLKTGDRVKARIVKVNGADLEAVVTA